MHLLIFHGYLLRGTGSNIYNANLARALVGSGARVSLFCQDRAAGELPFVDAVGTWVGGRLQTAALREPVRCTAYLPDIAGVLPLYVADRYDGFDARPFRLLDDAEVDRYVAANVAAVRDVASADRPDAALANHAVMGPAILARALGDDVPYAVKIHGSALEYTVKPHPERFLPFMLEGLARARGVLVGSRHTAESLWAVAGDETVRERTRLGPPGVDVDAFRPRTPALAAAGLRALAHRLDTGAAAGWGGEAGAGPALRALDPERQQIVAYVGKLIVAKGVDLLAAAWPLVAGAVPDARLVVVGFGAYRQALAGMVAALGRGDLGAVADLARRGRQAEGGPPGELRYLLAFLDGLAGQERDRYLTAARDAASRVVFTGRLEHAELTDLLPACQAQVVPSTFPESFGMVAAEAAACGVLPLSAHHSGLAEVTAGLSQALDEPLRPLLRFEPGPGAVTEIADKLVAWLRLDPRRRRRATESLAALARQRYSWQEVARGVVAAATGDLSALPVPGGS